MATDVTPTAELALDPTAQGAGNQPVQPDYEKQTTEWQKRFTGLQGKYQQEQDRWKATQATIATELDTAKSELARWQADKKLTDDALSTLQSRYDTDITELDIMRARTSRLDLLVKEFPELLPLESKGALPDGVEAEELRPKLTALREALGQRTVAVAAGATPPSPGGSPASTTDELQKLANEATTKGDLLAANKYWDEYFALVHTK